MGAPTERNFRRCSFKLHRCRFRQARRATTFSAQPLKNRNKLLLKVVTAPSFQKLLDSIFQRFFLSYKFPPLRKLSLKFIFNGLFYSSCSSIRSSSYITTKTGHRYLVNSIIANHFRKPDVFRPCLRKRDVGTCCGNLYFSYGLVKWRRFIVSFGGLTVN